VVLSDPGDDTLDGCEFVTGDTIWFCSARRGNLRSIDIYTARLTDGTWANWEGAGEVLNLDYVVGELHLSADGTALYYHTEREGGMGGMDIWLTRLVDGSWQEPENGQPSTPWASTAGRSSPRTEPNSGSRESTGAGPPSIDPRWSVPNGEPRS